MARVLLVSNQPTPNSQPGYADALHSLSATREIEGFEVVYALGDPAEPPAVRSARIADRVRRSNADLVLCLSLKDQVTHVEEIVDAMGGRTLVYWEGDAWGSRKRFPEEDRVWFEASTVVFSVAGPPQSTLLLAMGAREVRHGLHTYDQVLFENQIAVEPDSTVVSVGNNLARIPGVSGLPGSTSRRRLVSALRSHYGDELRLAGRGWPKRFGAEYVDYSHLGQFIQRGRVLAVWEHFPTYTSYASDRLPVGMISGRVQVTSRPSGPWWIPKAVGVFAHDNWRDALADLERLADLPWHVTEDLGLAAREWALGRISHVQSLRHMLHTFLPTVEAPPADPWANLPGPWLIR